MTLHLAVCMLGAVTFAALAFFVVADDSRDPIHLAFAGGAVTFAGVELLAALTPENLVLADAADWRRWSLYAELVGAAPWLLVSMGYARSNRVELAARLRPWLGLLLVGPLALAVTFSEHLFVIPATMALAVYPYLPLGVLGQALFVARVLFDVVVLVNLERTLRAASGAQRWRVKFMVLGIGSIFAGDLYVSSQALLFSSVNRDLDRVFAWILPVSAVLMLVALLRGRFGQTEVHLSRSLVYNSVTLAVASVYLIAVGVLARLIHHFGGAALLPVGTLFVFVALLGLTAILLSDQVRLAIRRFISQNFYRQGYDYRREWLDFTRRTTSVFDVGQLSAVVCQMLSKTVGLDSVTVWVYDPDAGRVTLGASTVLAADVDAPKEVAEAVRELLESLPEDPDALDFEDPMTREAAAFRDRHGATLRRTQSRFGFPLHVGGRLVGLLMTSERVSGEPLALEDVDLIRTMAAQAASSIANLLFLARTAESKEVAAFETLSAFFIHDLKNIASRISLTIQNLPSRFDNPEFREDALRILRQSVEKMNAMTSRLGSLREEATPRFAPADLRRLAGDVLDGLEPSLGAEVHRELSPVPAVPMDEGEIQKVLENLVLNANEAITDEGRITVETRTKGSWVVLRVSDTGCGMTEQFLETSLFRPFQTTKSKGLGIGMYQSARIVRAHGGRIWAESELGEGSTFWVMLPIDPTRWEGGERVRAGRR